MVLVLIVKTVIINKNIAAVITIVVSFGRPHLFTA